MNASDYINSDIVSKVVLNKFRNKNIFFLKIKNTFLNFPILWKFIIKDEDYDLILSGKYKETLISKILRHTFWGWPRIIDSKPWVDGGEGNMKSTSGFEKKDCNSLAAMNIFSSVVENKNSKILDLGCNCGRHMSILYEKGFTSLYGVDAMSYAFDKFEKLYPDTYSNSDLSTDLFQRYLRNKEDRYFDALYTNGATVELIHPAFNIVKEVCRVTERYVMFVISEHEQGYPRFWIYEFLREGFDLVFALRPMGQLSNNDHVASTSLLIFRRG